MHNLFDTSALSQEAEQTETLLQQNGVKLERIISFGHPTPDNSWYDQEQAEWVALLKGQAVLEYADGRTQSMAAGDTLFIPPHLRHRVKQVSDDALWLALFIKP